ncbi:AraC family transcriptional regulator [Methylobacterium sp. 391_Methyba4]|uniref:AraC family transcriptional regulator n=1 Tax=Methylobacterium sp. 391_Methyba4 TaxID=3038924 RepID=UPI00241C4124|nr:AraC family transcriptional regulator [Methylobacterium sp. 391_Methyba4]WFS06488.1 AraC family transcriptional regulator [Methylobacterium sp. 391_Methyba4]
MQSDALETDFSQIDDERVRREAWVRAISPVYEARIDEEVPRTVSFRSWKLGTVLFNHMRASAQAVERTSSQIAVQAVDHVVLRLYSSGRTGIDTAGGEAEIPHGGIVLFDLSQRARSVTREMSGLNLALPRRLFDARVGELSARHLDILRPESTPLIRLLGDHMHSVHAGIDGMDEWQRSLVSTATVALCNAAMTPVTDSAYNRPAIAAIEIRQFIEAHLGMADLGVDMICARFGLSRTPVYSLFEADGGVATYIRNRRLSRAMRMLTGAEAGPPRVSGVAYACGYESLKSFSKAFRARYGINPRDVGTGLRGVAQRESGDTLMSWIQEL